MWEKLFNEIIKLLERMTDYVEVATAVKRKELAGEVIESNKISINVPQDTAEKPVAEISVSDDTTEESPAREAGATAGGERWLKPRVAAKMLNITPTYLAHIAKEGWVPWRPMNGGKHREYPESVFSGKTVDDLRCRMAETRGTIDKERRWRVTDMMSAPTCHKAYSQGTPKNAHFSRVCKAKADGILNTYTLMGVEYINLDELGRFTDWWDKNYHQIEKNACADFHIASDAYCVHENDLIWVYTRDWNAQLQPTPEQLAAFNKVVATLPSLRIKDVRFFKADAIKKIETMRELLSHVEKVEK